ncbi:MAG: 3-methyladenine DNA glycosylase [Rhodothermales bacterium]|nr:3-methyladenine DNA glycosylase [Rhodothermales bacterium]
MAGSTHIVKKSDWKNSAAGHRNVLEPIILPYLDERSRGIKNPVVDFLFEYYSFRPTDLLKWSPGIGVSLEGQAGDLNLDRRFVQSDASGLRISTTSFPARRITGLKWVVSLLAKTESREPMFGCHGLHEWAMVYEADAVRHSQFALRLGHKRTNEVVRSGKLLCSHFDAFRFFTPPAAGLNNKPLSRQHMTQTEQPGCLHTNMDLYKWSTKFFPWISSEIIRETFLLALEIRTVDMRASPYDLSELGIEPIRIENEDGQHEYRQYQAAFAAKAAPLRKALGKVLNQLLASSESVQTLPNDAECPSAVN